MEDVAFDYRIAEGGWARVGFRLGSDSTEMAVSHVGEPLDHLITAVVALAEGEDRVQVSWQAKDDGRQWWSHFNWSFDLRSDAADVWVGKVRRGGGGQQGGTQVDGQCSMWALCTAISEGVNRLYLRTGIRGYAEATGTPFPVDGLDRLEALARVLSDRTG